MDTKNDYTPKRRFPGFEGEWEQRKLADIVEINSGKDYKHLIEGEVPVYGTGGYMLSVSEALSYRDGIGIGRKGTIDKPYILRAPFWTVDTLFYCVPKEKDDLQFVNAIFERINWRSYDESTGVPSLSKVIINNIQVFSSCIDEQRTIGDFLLKVEKQISLHQHKLDKLKNLKKAYLSEMFPAEGERVPKRRFPGFEGEWEQKKLGQLMDVGSVKRVHQSDWRDRGVRFLRARDIVSESKNNRPDEFLYIDEELYKKYSAISGVVEKGDLLVTGVGTIGVPMLVESSEPLYFKDGNIIWFKNKNLLDGHFFYYSFTARAIQKFIGDVAGVGTVGTYTIDSGKNTPILLPVTKEEQVVIGNFFNKLDQSISLQQQKLDELNDLKKAYLNELFV